MDSYIQRVQIRYYKSLANVKVDLRPFTVFVGPNGSGKSNFIDALAFVQQCLADSIELAFKSRGGIGAVRMKSGGHPTHIGIGLNLILEVGAYAEYVFLIAAEPKENFRVARERCIVKHIMGPQYEFEVRDGEFIKEIPGIRPKISMDRLSLFAASGIDEFRPVYDFLTSMRFYSIAPARLRELQEPDPGEYLKREGSNAAAILKRLQDTENGMSKYERICRLLSRVVEGVERIEYHSVGQKETLRFKQQVGLRYPWTFDATNMSDGTLRVLGLLLSVYQQNRSTVIGIEEPEATVHPAVAELVVQILMEASRERQIITTTHSPDIIDHKTLSDEQIRGVLMKNGKTIIAPLSDSSREAIRSNLYTPGELLRNNELNIDIEKEDTDKQLDIFDRPFFEGK